MNELFDIEGKCALVTGGSRGIGEMIASAYVAAGVRTYISSRKADACYATAERLSELGSCTALPADLSGRSGIELLAEEIAGREPRLDILVNNAGAAWGESLEKYSESAWDKVMDINVKGPFFLTQILLPQLEAAAAGNGPARIINVGSVDGINISALPTFAYGPSKAALHHLTRTLASHLADRNITVNAIAPGPFPSKMMAHTLETRGEKIKRGVPLGRIGEPSDIAGAVIYLSSPAANYVTGVVLPVDGGITGCARTLT